MVPDRGNNDENEEDTDAVALQEDQHDFDKSLPIQSSSAKTLVARRWQTQLNKVRAPFLMWPFIFGKPYSPRYAIEELECKIYDNVHHHSSKGLLLPLHILSIDQNLEPPPNILRFMSRKAYAAAVAMLVVVAVSCVMTPLTFVFYGSWDEPEDIPGGRAALIVDLVLDVFYFMYLCLELKMSYLDPSRRVEVVKPSKILRFRLCHPVYALRFLGATNYIWIAGAKVNPALNFVKIIRLYHTVQLPDALWLHWDSSWLRAIRPVLQLVALSHWIACLFSRYAGYGEALRANGASSYETRFEGQTVDGKLSLYLISFVESLYMLTGALDNPIGDGGIRQSNFGSLVIVMVFGPIGAFFVAYFISVLVREQAMRWALETRQEEKKAFVTRALENLNVPVDLQRRVFSLLYYQKMSHDFEAFEQLFSTNTLSRPLEDAIRVYLYQNVVVHSNFFSGKDSNYILSVVRVLEDKLYLPGDYIVRAGEVASEMYFINAGECSARVHGGVGRPLDVNQSIVVGPRKKPGDYFGEVSLIQGSLRTAWVIAETYVVLSCLRRAAIEEIWKYFPAERDDLVQHVTRLVQNDKDRNRMRGASQAAHVVARMRSQVCRRASEREPDEPKPLFEAQTVFSQDTPSCISLPQEGDEAVVSDSVVVKSLRCIEGLCESLATGQGELMQKMEDLQQRQQALEMEFKNVKASEQPRQRWSNRQCQGLYSQQGTQPSVATVEDLPETLARRKDTQFGSIFSTTEPLDGQGADVKPLLDGRSQQQTAVQLEATAAEEDRSPQPSSGRRSVGKDVRNTRKTGGEVKKFTPKKAKPKVDLPD
eukprot:TRINITY_DN73068_c0_g1_i1.p1 TRINITY_DN73068_c0_g1~~TRINITY_DN73068_c0_g1_i1.p1  ORF type:complete len:821 (+),score=142.85 TRINITY_DN73068_c0_g1_i1:217-2679(+)